MSGDGTGIDDPTQVRPLDVDALVADPTVGVIVFCGAGGVGKTTTVAALAPPIGGGIRGLSELTGRGPYRGQAALAQQ